MSGLQPVDSVALDAQQLRHEAGQLAATALWDESAAAGLLLFCLPEAGTTLECCQHDPPALPCCLRLIRLQGQGRIASLLACTEMAVELGSGCMKL